MLRRSLAAFLLAPLLLAAACSDDGGGSRASGPTVDETVAHIADEVIVPGYQLLAERTHDLVDAADALCATPSASTLEAAQDAWRQANRAWRASRAGGIGPAMDRRLTPALGFLARPASVQELLDGDTSLDADAIEEAGAAVKGFSALELALFGDGSDTLATPAGARRCQYTVGVATLAHRHSQQVLDDWTGGYRDELVTKTDGQEALGMIVNELSHRLTELDDQGLRSLAEADSLDDLSANRLDGPAAFHLAELQAQLDGASAVIGDQDAGLVALLQGRDADLATRLAEADELARRSLDALPDSVAKGFATATLIDEAQKKVAALKVLVTTEVASELGITISFSDADGDS